MTASAEVTSARGDQAAPKRIPRSLGASHYVFAAVLLLRLVSLTRLMASSSALPTSGDMQFYAEWAQRIARGQFTEHLAFFGLPFYAYFLAALSAVFGPTPFAPGLVQTICDAGTATLLYKICTRVWREPPSSDGAQPPLARGQIIGIVAAAGWALFLPAQAYAIVLMPTVLAVFVFWFVVWQVVKTDELAPAHVWLLGGLLVGLAATAVATVLFAMPLLVAAIFLKRDARPGGAADWKRRGCALLLVFGGVAAGTAPCSIHNRFVAHDPVFLSAHSGINFWIGNNPDASGYPRFTAGLRAEQRAMLEDSTALAEAAAGRPLKRSEVSKYWSSKARDYISAQPVEWLKLLGTKVTNFWNAFTYDDLSIINRLRDDGVVFPGLRFGLVAALAFPGAWFTLCRSRRAGWIAAAVVLEMAAVLPVFVTERYRLAAVPGLMIFAAAGLMLLWEFAARADLRKCGWYGALLAAATIFISLPRRDRGLWALEPYSAGRQALEAGNLPLAQEKLELAFAYVPDNAEVNLALGNLSVERKDFTRAEQYYRAALQLDPRHKSAVTNLGVVALEQKQVARALGLFRASVAAAPGDAKAHYLLARALLETGDRVAAQAESEKAVQLQPEQPEFLALRDALINPAR